MDACKEKASAYKNHWLLWHSREEIGDRRQGGLGDLAHVRGFRFRCTFVLIQFVYFFASRSEGRLLPAPQISCHADLRQSVDRQDPHPGCARQRHSVIGHEAIA